LAGITGAIVLRWSDHGTDSRAGDKRQPTPWGLQLLPDSRRFLIAAASSTVVQELLLDGVFL
jgi:hypothetical protein